MFRTNQHHQKSLFDSPFWMSKGQKEMLENSWAHTFREEIFDHIPEMAFAHFYSDKDSRPNSAVNVIIGADFLKNGFGMTDRELEEALHFNLQFRHALRIDDLGEAPPTMRTFRNFRRNVCMHAKETGENLYQEVFNTITDHQLDTLKINTDWQRMDSVQLLSNIARMNRLELVIAVFQKGVKGLSGPAQEKWYETEAIYLNKPAQNVCYHLKDEESETHLIRLGGLLETLLSELKEIGGDETLISLLKRTLGEHYHIEEEKQPILKAGGELDGNSLQSPHDPEATYRKKRGTVFKGYVANVSETCDPMNEIQLIASLGIAPNTTDDGELLKQALEEMAERGVNVKEMTVDGGYNGPTADEACEAHQVHLRPTTVRGGKTQSGRFGWEEYSWTFNEDRVPIAVSCPQGETVPLEVGSKPDWFLARFDRSACEGCPFFEKECRIKNLKRTSPTLNIKRSSIRAAIHRQGISPQNYAIRSNVESTIHAVKKPFAGGKLPVRGLIRTMMVVCGSALVANMRRLHRYIHQEIEKDQEIGEVKLNGATALLVSCFWHLIHAYIRSYQGSGLEYDPDFDFIDNLSVQVGI